MFYRQLKKTQTKILPPTPITDCKSTIIRTIKNHVKMNIHLVMRGFV